MTQPSSRGEGSLVGIRVVEIGTSVAAPMATQILGDLGAEVIKVERIGTGDDSRSWAPPDWDGESITFLSLNRNKKSIALDFKNPRGREALERLISGSDVLIQNLRPGALVAAGFSSERLYQLNPRLIYCEITGFGRNGPRAGQSAYDPLLQAYSGIVSITGEEGGDPVRVPVSLLDMGTGMWTALAVYEALRHRDQTGAGSHIEISLLQTALTWLSMPLMSVLAGNPAQTRMGSGLSGVVPYGAFPASDGYVFICAGNDELWDHLCAALGAHHLKTLAICATNPDRVRHRNEVNAALSAVTCAFDVVTLLTRLTAERVPCAPVNTLDDVVADPQVQAIGAFSHLQHPGIDNFTVINLPMTFDGSYIPHTAPPPTLGSDTAQILTSIGFSADEIAELHAAGVVDWGTNRNGEDAHQTGAGS